MNTIFQEFTEKALSTDQNFRLQLNDMGYFFVQQPVGQARYIYGRKFLNSFIN